MSKSNRRRLTHFVFTPQAPGVGGGVNELHMWGSLVATGGWLRVSGGGGGCPVLHLFTWRARRDALFRLVCFTRQSGTRHIFAESFLERSGSGCLACAM